MVSQRHGALATLFALMHTAFCDVQFPPDDPRFVYEGRWQPGSGLTKTDWPCSSVRFTVQAAEAGSSVTVHWLGLRDRINMTVSSGSDTVQNKLLLGSAVDLPFRSPQKETVTFTQKGAYTIRLRKLTTAAPFGMGVGGDFLKPSLFEFHGLDAFNVTIQPSAPLGRRMEFIGASDTAGYCVDGTPDMRSVEIDLFGWKYENCDLAYPGRLASYFDAAVAVEAISGIGLTQNANAKQKWQLGPNTMPTYFNRTLQTEKGHFWNFSTYIPDVVLVSLGGNDFNHQDGDVPSNATFNSAYENFVTRIYAAYGPATTVVSVCGQGTPEETKSDPDNNRCRPCENVEIATDAFKRKYPHLSVHFVFVPCDGSAATGNNDIGCRGHKNIKGQHEVANYLRPRIASIMNWTENH